MGKGRERRFKAHFDGAHLGIRVGAVDPAKAKMVDDLLEGREITFPERKRKRAPTIWDKLGFCRDEDAFDGDLS